MPVAIVRSAKGPDLARPAPCQRKKPDERHDHCGSRAAQRPTQAVDLGIREKSVSVLPPVSLDPLAWVGPFQARPSASAPVMSAGSPMIFHMCWPSCWLCRKNRFRPLSSTLTPKSAVSRTFRVLFFGRRSRTRALVSRGMFLFLHPIAAPDETAKVFARNPDIQRKKTCFRN